MTDLMISAPAQVCDCCQRCALHCLCDESCRNVFNEVDEQEGVSACLDCVVVNYMNS